MKDAYSLDIDRDGLDLSYQKHYDAYCKIFDRCGLQYIIVGASSGAMGGKQSQEFMLESEAGEDIVAIADDGYAANLEIAQSGLKPLPRIEPSPELTEFPTPNAKTINDLVEQFNFPEMICAKSVVYIVNNEPILILMRGNDQLNESKLSAALGTNLLRPAEPDELLKYTGANAGSIGPINLKTKMRVIADLLLKDANGLVSGANKDGYHYKNIDFTRDCKIDEYYDLRIINEGEPSPINGAPIRISKTIELGHIFKLGTRYSEALGAKFLDKDGNEKPIIMGSYGIGVERIIASFIEQNYDERGIIWNKALTPFDVHLISINQNKFPEVFDFSQKMSDNLENAGFEVLWDDRDESAGVKFNDADLIGIPIQIIVSNKNLANGNLEIKLRHTNERRFIPIENIINELKQIYSELK
ncbi:MAG TPA: proline--tRNA ligase [Candidatus Kapabacteria bacterium]|nr:proline--tRNA ligase [Candidatus Kapabacteria bacterium]